jgi:hypothetical protein
MTVGASPNNPFPGNAGYAGSNWFLSGGTDYNVLAFVISQILAGKNFAAVVQVNSCTNSGAVSPAGFVSATPLVGQIDGFGNVVPHIAIANLPYFRLQAGSNAVIIDPQVGDIGLAIFCDRDISLVKKTNSAAAPGSFRKNNWADGIYIGGIIGQTSPTTYVQFQGGNINLHASVVNITGNVNINGNTALTGGFTVNGKNVSDSHGHSGVQTGGGQTGPVI